MLQRHQRIFGLGLSRTGTSTLAKALQMLGIATLHYPDDETTFAELAAAHYQLSILKKFQAIVDVPAAPFYAQFDKQYPGSKFILTIREQTSWLKSVQYHWSISPDLPDADPQRKFRDFIRATVFGALQFSEERFRFVYETHTRNVRDFFAHRPDDLLVLDICAGDGWEKLCPFLGLPVPDAEFPHDNRGSEREIWSNRVQLVAQELERLIPSGEKFILVDGGQLSHNFVPGREAVPFMERFGYFWGPPPDDDTALRELSRLEESGGKFIVFLWSSFWWLDFYEQLHVYLREKFPCALKNDRVIVFDLRSPA